MEKKVSIIICAYNEESTIESVVRECHDSNPGSEIVVIDDGSKDKTPQILAEIAGEIPVKVVSLEENQGKSFAMVTGVENAANEIILFWDADVTGIRKEHFEQMLEPLKSDEQEADMVLGVPKETLIDYRINPFKSLTGERALLKNDIEPILENIRDIRFGVETYINLHFQALGKKIKYTLLEGLEHPTKYEKTSSIKATKEFVSEGKEIALTLLQNYDLITKRISNSFEETGQKVRTSIEELQKEMNEKVQALLKNNG